MFFIGVFLCSWCTRTFTFKCHIVLL